MIVLLIDREDGDDNKHLENCVTASVYDARVTTYSPSGTALD
jgi:hypothetical protein